jgi:inorganic phosphate transporter, PiT family
MEFPIFILIVVLALTFDYINGFHDAANAIATVVSTKVLSPRIAVLYGAVLNFAGAMMGTQVAATIGKGIVDPHMVTPDILVFTMIGAILWNLFTWYLGLPTSSSHALIGSLCGAMTFGSAGGLFFGGLVNVKWDGLLQKVIMPMLTSPLMGLLLGYLLMLGLFWLLHKVSLSRVNFWSAKLQILSAGFMALSHGSNDAQKSMGIIALAIATFYGSKFHVDMWVVIACAAAMGLGTLSGGWKIIRTLGTKMIKLQPINGFAAETAAGSIILVASHFGIPVSTTQVISSSIMGVGSTKRLSAVKWGVVGNIVWAWVLTLPLTFLLSGGLYWVYNRLWH